MIYSLVITVLNEEKTIERLIEALKKQTKKPDEIIFVDAGSTDKTIKKIQNSKFKIFVKPGASIAQGRNFGIKKARGEIIVMTDAGCVPHSDWFEKIIKPFEKENVDVVAGFYKMTGETVFQKCLACYLGVLPERLDPKNFLPSTRSIAFKKEIWKKVGGFSEKLEKAGEDTLFAYQAKKIGAKFLTEPLALVDWEMPRSWREAIKKFYSYAKGDAETGIWWHPLKCFFTHNLKVAAIFLRYVFGLFLFLFGFYLNFFWVLLLGGFFLYLVWAILKNYNYIKKQEAIFLLPMLQVISDISIMTGFIRGILGKK